MRAVVRSRIAVWLAFVGVHLWLGLLNLHGPGFPLGDVVQVYPHWLREGFVAGQWLGIDQPWVYPILALVPMLAAATFGFGLYASTWLTIVMLLNAVAFGFITGWGRRRERVVVGWWWVGFLLLLGPIALGRIDSITVPIGIIAVLVLATRPRVAALLLAVGAWMKIWPAAVLLAAVIALRARWRMLGVAVAVTGVVVLVSLLLGSGIHVLGFITEQAGRGLQVEAPAATLWLWRGLAGEPGTGVYYDTSILTYQVAGHGVGAMAAATTPALAVAVLAFTILGVLAVRRGVGPGDLLPALALGLVTSLIAFNKVGSPQFVSWLAVPIVLGIAVRVAGHGRSFRVPGALVLAIAGLTQFIYPYLYDALLTLDPYMLVVITVRNLLYFVLVGWAIHAIVTAPRAVDMDEDPYGEWLPRIRAPRGVPELDEA